MFPHSNAVEPTEGQPFHDLHDDAPTVHRPRHGKIRRSARAMVEFVHWVVFMPVRLFRAKGRAPDEVIVYAAHPSFFLWLLIVVGFVEAAVVRYYPATAEVAGWIYVGTLVYFVLALLYDLSTRKLLLWTGIFALIWLGSKYVEHLREVALLGYVLEYLTELSPRLDPGTVTVLSWLLLLPWLGSLFDMIFNGRKKFTPNDIGEFHFGEGSELTDRSGLRFRTKYRDVLETVLTFGGGDLIAVDNNQTVVKRWNNIIGLFFLWKSLDRILHQRAVVDSEAEIDV